MINAKDWNDVIIAYRNGGPLRIRDIGQAVQGPKTSSRPPGPMASARVPGRLQAARRQRHRHRGQDQIDAAAAGCRYSAAIKIDVISDRTQTIRAAVEDVQSPCF